MYPILWNEVIRISVFYQNLLVEWGNNILYKKKLRWGRQLELNITKMGKKIRLLVSEN